MRPFGRRGSGERGAVIPFIGLVLPVLMVATAFSVDLGRQRALRRDLQADADVIALDLVRMADGRTENDIVSPQAYLDALNASFARNDVPTVSRLNELADVVEWGTWESPAGFVRTMANEVPNAVQVTLDGRIDYFFQPGTGDAVRTAVATRRAVAGFQIGTRLASVNSDESTLLNTLLGQALNGAVDLTAVGYQGLLDNSIRLQDLASELGLGSPDELAEATVSARDFYVAAAEVMRNQGDTAAASALDVIAAQTASHLVLDMGDLVEIEQGGSQAAANAAVDLYSLVIGSVYAINGTSTLSVPSLSITVPNVAALGAHLDVTQRPQAAFGPVGTSVQTQQVDLGLTSTVHLPISVVGLTGATVRGTVPLRTTVAGATGTLSGIACSRPGIDVGLAPQPIAVTSGFDLVVYADVPLLGDVPVAEIVAPSIGFTANGASNGASFLYPTEFLPPVGSGTMVPSAATQLGLANSVVVQSGHVSVLGIVPVSVPDLVSAVNDVLNPALVGLDTLVVDQVNDLLGLDIGGADIGALGMDCGNPVLVE